MRVVAVLERLERTANDCTGDREAWGELAKFWAKKTAAGTSESQPDEQTVAIGSVTLETHWTPTLATATPLMRVRLPEENKVLAIKSVVDPDGAHRSLVFVCEEVS